jgi:hypothetical protein
MRFVKTVIKYSGFLLLFQIQVNHLFTWYYGGQKILTVSFCHFKKKNCKPYFIVIMIIVLIIIGTFWVVNFKTRNYFVIFSYTDVNSGYLCTTALILFIHVGFLEYLSFKQFKLIVRITICMSK